MRTRIAFVTLALLGNVHAADLGPIVGAFKESKPLLDTRLRFEDVDQDPMSQEAEALTLRSRIGFETGKAWDTSLLAEGEFLWPLSTDYNSTTNGKAIYPIVADRAGFDRIHRTGAFGVHAFDRALA